MVGRPCLAPRGPQRVFASALARAVFPCAFVLAGLLAAPAAAQVDGHVSVQVDALPDPDPASGRQGVVETRTRLFVEHRRQVGDHLRLVLSGHVDGLVPRVTSGTDARWAATARPLDLYAEWSWSRADLRVGASRLVWGRLDEFQPTDVVNPLDVSRFLLEGRTEARLAVGLVRTRVFLPGSTTLELVGVPGFRPGRFDQLDEASSPFNLGVQPRALVDRREPAFGTSSTQGGARLTSTLGRVDVGVTAYRGIRAFPIVTALVSPVQAPPIPGGLQPAGLPTLPIAGPIVSETFPRFTMVGADFETARGAWGMRGEAAFFVRDTLQSTTLARGVTGSSFEGGVGLDRKAGSYRLAGNVLVSHRSPGDALPESLVEPSARGTDVSLVLAADRSFARETRTLRLFSVVDPENGTTFTRAIAAVNVRDNVWLEGSGGVFTGRSTTTLGRLTNRDFLYARVKVHF